MTTIAWLGAGLLGSGFVEAARGRGLDVRVWNRSPAKARALEACGAVACASVEDAARGASRVHLCLADDAAVEAVLTALLPALPRGVPVVDHSTVSPEGARARAARLAEAGVPFAQAPVFMAPAAARAAGGIMLVAGPRALVEALAPDLAAMTGKLLREGEDAGRPATLKLLGNAMIVAVTAGLADAYTIARGGGVSATDAHALFSHLQVGATVAGRGARMAEGDFGASFELTMARKDVRLMLEAGGEGPWALLPGLAARMDALLARGHGADDLGVLALDAVPAREAVPTPEGSAR